eukprot:3365226-Prymnesium_polylepis.1
MHPSTTNTGRHTTRGSTYGTAYAVTRVRFVCMHMHNAHAHAHAVAHAHANMQHATCNMQHVHALVARALSSPKSVSLHRQSRHCLRPGRTRRSVATQDRRLVVAPLDDLAIALALLVVLHRVGALLVCRELRVPHVDDQHEARLIRLVVHRVLEGVVEEQHLALGPSARLAADDDLAVALRDNDAKVRAQPR